MEELMEAVGWFVICVIILTPFWIYLWWHSKPKSQKTFTDPVTTKMETPTKPKRIIGVIGKVDGSYDYVCLDKYGIVWIGFSIWWYMLDGKNCGNNYNYFNDKYHAAKYKEAAGHVYSILNMADLLDDNKRKELLERLNA